MSLLYISKDVFNYVVMVSGMGGKDLLSWCQVHPRFEHYCSDNQLFQGILWRDFKSTLPRENAAQYFHQLYNSEMTLTSYQSEYYTKPALTFDPEQAYAPTMYMMGSTDLRECCLTIFQQVPGQLNIINIIKDDLDKYEIIQIPYDGYPIKEILFIGVDSFQIPRIHILTVKGELYSMNVLPESIESMLLNRNINQIIENSRAINYQSGVVTKTGKIWRDPFCRSIIQFPYLVNKFGLGDGNAFSTIDNKLFIYGYHDVSDIKEIVLPDNEILKDFYDTEMKLFVLTVSGKIIIYNLENGEIADFYIQSTYYDDNDIEVPLEKIDRMIKIEASDSHDTAVISVDNNLYYLRDSIYRVDTNILHHSIFGGDYRVNIKSLYSP
tara:strand:+ start:20622 stop:21764 length:1143 start_codon:yes stop_codon:yes gene_type:complete